jgi:rare lipoprotein A
MLKRIDWNLIYLILLTGLMIGYCTHLPSPRDNISISPDQLPAAQSSDPQIFQTGIASWYGKDFHGKRTANGEIYDMYKLTAAHKTLPFNTFVMVENLDNNHKTIVRINDRGPFVKDRIIDLSFKAAHEIAMENKGTAQVVLKIVKPAQQTPRLEHISSVNDGFYLQAGAFSVKQNAFNLLKRVRRLIPELAFSVYFKSGLYKIISKAIVSRSQAEKYQQRLRHDHIESYIKQHH